ncbi:MAG: hypothetical protein JWO02_1111 [Solirubrobacterales bacterium]|nr:hypothetical protein [Solirubrobacterales bacterium]
MICAHAVRRLKPGTFEQFAQAFMPDTSNPPPGWVRFVMLRGSANENEVVTFGFFDGTMDQMQASQDAADYSDRVNAVAPYVDEVVTNGVYNIVMDLKVEGATA